MAYGPLDVENLAKAAAAQVEAHIAEMLQAGEEGEIIVALGANEVTIHKRPKQFVFRERVERGHYTVVQRTK